MHFIKKIPSTYRGKQLTRGGWINLLKPAV